MLKLLYLYLLTSIVTASASAVRDRCSGRRCAARVSSAGAWAHDLGSSLRAVLTPGTSAAVYSPRKQESHVWRLQRILIHMFCALNLLVL